MTKKCSTDNMELDCGETLCAKGEVYSFRQVWCFTVMCWNTGVKMVMCDVVRTWCVTLFGHKPKVHGAWMIRCSAGPSLGTPGGSDRCDAVWYKILAQ